MVKKRILNIIIIVLVALSVPIIAMQFTSEVDWDIVDFLVMGILLFSVFFLIDLFWRSLKNKNYKWVAVVIILVLFLLVWAELAVGILGSPFAGN